MAIQNAINLYDRVKELTYTQGTINFALAGAADGFSPLSRFFSHNELVFYAATDGIRYEIGSGIYRRADFDPDDDISYNELQRFPFRTSNSDNSIVNFPPGVKEVFITYTATHSVMMGSGLPNLNVPQRKGIAVWDSENILNYFDNFIFDSSLNAIGLNKNNPIYGLDLGGDSESYSSRIRASGYYAGPVGIFFQPLNGGNANLGLTQPPYSGGTQYVHFSPNLTDSALSQSNQTNSHLVIQVSGDVNQYILLQKQDAHTVFAGPIDDCNPSCANDYPLFRRLVIDDIPDLSTLYASFEQLMAVSGSLNEYIDLSLEDFRLEVSGVKNHCDVTYSGVLDNFTNFEIATSGRVTNFITVASGILFPYTAVITKTLGAFSNHEVRAESFTVSGVVASDKYSVSMSPSTMLNEDLLLTYAFVSNNNEVQAVFHAPTGCGSQTKDFHITVHKINHAS